MNLQRSQQGISKQIINTTIKIFVLIQDSESQLINKCGNVKLKNKLNTAAQQVSQVYLLASLNFESERARRTQSHQAPPPAGLLSLLIHTVVALHHAQFTVFLALPRRWPKVWLVLTLVVQTFSYNCHLRLCLFLKKKTRTNS